MIVIQSKGKLTTTITIHNLDGELAESLRVAAARHGNSIEEEACYILRQTLGSITKRIR
ncbi:FitA-like ribbon-helix-helix domain-containing protein [Leminorella grimontii]